MSAAHTYYMYGILYGPLFMCTVLEAESSGVLTLGPFELKEMKQIIRQFQGVHVTKDLKHYKDKYCQFSHLPKLKFGNFFGEQNENFYSLESVV